jgi:predicted RNase H-like HicB family nuclease
MSNQIFALIHEEHGIFGISFPDFPGCISGGATMDEALRRGREALAFHVAGMLEDGDPLPSLRDLTELRSDPNFLEDAKDAIILFLPLDLPGHVARVNVSFDTNLLERIDRAAKARGETRSGFLAEAAKERLANDASPPRKLPDLFS